MENNGSNGEKQGCACPFCGGGTVICGEIATCEPCGKEFASCQKCGGMVSSETKICPHCNEQLK